MRYQAVPQVLSDVYAELRTAMVPSTLVRVDAQLRFEAIPEVVEQAYFDLRTLTIPVVLTEEYAKLRVSSIQEVLRAVYADLQRDSVPDVLLLTMRAQHVRTVPSFLTNEYPKFTAAVAPSILKQMFVDICTTYTREILAALYMNYALDESDGRSLPQAFIDIWDQWRLGQTARDLDSMAPFGLSFSTDLASRDVVGLPRYGFEVNLHGVFGRSPSSNTAGELWNQDKEFSFLNEADGFPKWLRAVEGDESMVVGEHSITYGMAVELGHDITEEQTRAIVAWLRSWFSNPIVVRNRQNQWRLGRTNHPSVDADLVNLEHPSKHKGAVQHGFELPPPPDGTDAISAEAAHYL